MDRTTIILKKNTHKRLKIYGAEQGMKSNDESINALLDLINPADPEGGRNNESPT